MNIKLHRVAIIIKLPRAAMPLVCREQAPNQAAGSNPVKLQRAAIAIKLQRAATHSGYREQLLMPSCKEPEYTKGSTTNHRLSQAAAES